MPTDRLPTPALRPLAAASADRISALLDYYLGNGMLFDALHALSILEGVKAPTTLTELASQYTRRIRTALRWGVREHLITNRVAEDIRPTPERYKQPGFFKPDRVARIMRTAEEHPGEARAAAGITLTLGFFAGIRTVEIARAVWDDIKEEEKIVRIPQPKGYTRGVRARVVELEDNAVAWIRFWKDEARRAGKVLRGKVVETPRSFCGWKKTYLEPNGDSWGNDEAHNVMRHTYATMHVGAFRDLKATALNLGHPHGQRDNASLPLPRPGLADGREDLLGDPAASRRLLRNPSGARAPSGKANFSKGFYPTSGTIREQGGGTTRKAQGGPDSDYNSGGRNARLNGGRAGRSGSRGRARGRAEEAASRRAGCSSRSRRRHRARVRGSAGRADRFRGCARG